jgi:energy-converting hydrogenase A subunit R
MKKRDIWVVLDNEGPQTKNDNAQENTAILAEQCGLGQEVGADFYQRISTIDDIWGDFHKIAKDPNYSSGHTLKVVLPFFKAMGATSQWLYAFAKESIKVVPNIAGVVRSLDSKYNVRQISTSYDFFIRAYCDLIGFEFGKSACTTVPVFDSIAISKEDNEVLKAFMKEVATWPIIQYDQKTGKVFPSCDSAYNAITGFIWEFVYYLPAGTLLQTVHPVGQQQKREVLIDIAKEHKIPREKIFYVGDSQTDVGCIQYIKGEGLTMMFNGKGKVCDDSDLMYIGEDASIIEEVADLFAQHGREWVIEYYTPQRQAYHGMIAAVTPQNLEELKGMSSKKRKEFRGVSIGELT